MNIFITSPDPAACAVVLCDAHVRKMLMESAQMLIAAIQAHDPSLTPSDDGLCKPTHAHHPCNVWVRSSRTAARWLLDHAIALAAEYRHRRDMDHATARRLPTIAVHLDVIPAAPMPPFYADVPDDLRDLDVFEAYRRTLRRKHAEWLAARAAGNLRKPDPRWTRRDRPDWS